MKCFTKSCQRSKNILANGFCNTCDEAKKLDKPQKMKATKEIEVDVKEIEVIYNKLKVGDTVDQNVVNSIIIGGILSFISQKEATLALAAKVSELESDLKTAKLRIESLENWMNRNDEDKKATKKDLKECSNMIVELGKKKEGPVTCNEAVTKSFQKKCDKCGEIFDKNSDFEIHMEEVHKVDKIFKCELCGKIFLLEWRLRKHGNVHIDKPKKCKFMLNKETCPFDRIGCKFDHDNLEDDSEIETSEEEHNLDQNQCHLCRLQLQSNDHLMDHIEAVHVDYFQGIMEYAAGTRT